MPTKTTGKGLQRVTSRVWYVTNPDKPCPQEHVKKRSRPCCAALEKRKRKLGMHVKIYSFESRFCLLTILMDSQVSKSLKQRFLILLLVSLCISLSLSFRSSDQLQQTVPIIHLFSAMRSIINGHQQPAYISIRAVLARVLHDPLH